MGFFKGRTQDGYNPIPGHRETQPQAPQAGRRNDEKAIDHKKHAAKKPIESGKATQGRVVSRGGHNFGKMMAFQANHQKAKPMQRRGGSNAPVDDGMEEY